MTSTSLNIAGKIDPNIVTIFEIVSQALADIEIPYVVVGATARELVLHYGHGAKIERATQDVDFAIEVPNWKAFETLKEKLCEQGFKATQAQHRLISPTDGIVDIVPFGRIEDEEASIAWPPKGEVTMNVIGFQEAYDTAEWVRIQDEPELDIPVATPAGMMLLKLNSMDRPHQRFAKKGCDGYRLSAIGLRGYIGSDKRLDSKAALIRSEVQGMSCSHSLPEKPAHHAYHGSSHGIRHPGIRSLTV